MKPCRPKLKIASGGSTSSPRLLQGRGVHLVTSVATGRGGRNGQPEGWTPNGEASRPQGKGIHLVTSVATGLRGNGGFTMIEIALCIAIIGFALVAIIGILPAGMQVQKDNREDTV